MMDEQRYPWPIDYRKHRTVPRHINCFGYKNGQFGIFVVIPGAVRDQHQIDSWMELVHGQLITFG